MFAYRSQLLLALCTACAALGGGCAVPPLVRDAGSVGPSVLATIADARSTSANTTDGVTLRGAFVEAPAQAPVILHLLPSGASVQTGVPLGIGRVGLSSCLEALRREGFSSVVFDYRGVGSSDGIRDTARILDDGKAMWHEAVRFAGGREDQVIIRAGSLGTLVAAALLNDGAKPAGVILIAPVRSSTIAHHAIASERGWVWALLTSFMYRSPGAPDLEDVVVHSSVPTLSVLPAHDQYLPARESAIIATALKSRGNAVVDFPGDHQAAVLQSWNFEIDPSGDAGRQMAHLTDAEREFLKRRLVHYYVYDGHIPTMQAMTRLQLKSGRPDETTRAMLEEIALKGETETWRSWARQHLVRLSP